MSQLTTGLETLDGIGSTQANSLFDADIQRLDEFARDFVPFTMFGAAQDGVTFGKIVLPYDVYVEAVILNAHSGPPTGQNLVARIKIDGVVQGTDFSLPPASVYAKATPATPTTILATAGQSIEVFFSQVGSADPGLNVTCLLQLRKRLL